MNGYRILIKRLTGLLEEETELFESLFFILIDEKKALTSARMNKLNEACKEKENIILKIRILEEQRIRVLQKISTLNDCPHENITMEGLSELADEDEYARLRKCRSNLLSLAESIGELNNSNRSLLNHSIDFVRTSLSFLDNFISPRPLYFSNGQIRAYEQSGRIFSGHH